MRIATEVAAALDYAHRRGVVHRDVKPENVLLHDGAALVADFGIALVARAAGTAGAARATGPGMPLGTPRYMSPEQATGARRVTARADVWALGAVLYEMLAGEPAFAGPTAQAVMARIATGPPPPLAARRPAVPAYVEAAVRTALEKLPADRFESARAFADALAASGAAPAAPRPPGDAASGAARRRVAPRLAGRDSQRRRPGRRGAGAAETGPRADALAIAASERADMLVALDDALVRLAELDPRLGRVVECRFFAGLTEAETAATLGVTKRTVRRDWVKARGWLYAELRRDLGEDLGHGLG